MHLFNGKKAITFYFYKHSNMKHETFSSQTSYSYWSKGNILRPTATQRPIWLESPVTWSCCFSATGSYVLSHFPLNNPSLHKTCNQLSGYSEGTERQHCYISRRGRAVEGERKRERERKRGKPCPTFHCQSGTK